MKQSGTAILLAAFALTTFSACEKVIGEGPLVTETRNATNFTGIDLRMSGSVHYTQGPDYKVEIRAQQNILEVLETYVSNNKLVIKLSNDTRVRRHEDIDVLVTAPSMNSLRVSGSGAINAAGLLAGGNVELDVNGSGTLNVADLQADLLDASISGSGDIHLLHGTAAEERFRITGSGNIDASNIVGRLATTHTSGSGNTSLHVSERLNVTITGSGSVYYRGQPAVNSKITGSGKVKQL